MEEEKPSLIDKNDLIKDLIQPAKRGARFINYVIDIIFFYIFFLGTMFVYGFLSQIFGWDLSFLNNDLIVRLYGFLFLAAYYLFFEVVVGKTIGKMITKTKVVNEDGSKPSFGTLVKRNLSRLIPFDAFSYFSERPTGWHDRISNTMVVDDINLYQLNDQLKKAQPFEGEEEVY